MSLLYGEDLCSRCAFVDFRIPCHQFDKQGYLKVSADFKRPVCNNCPIEMKIRNEFSILINTENKILALGDICELDSLANAFRRYLDQLDDKRIKKFDSRLIWAVNSDLGFITNVLVTLKETHFEYVISKQGLSKKDICKMNSTEFKTDYSMNIVFDLGSLDAMKPSIQDSLKTSTEEIKIENEPEMHYKE